MNIKLLSLNEENQNFLGTQVGDTIRFEAQKEGVLQLEEIRYVGTSVSQSLCFYIQLFQVRKPVLNFVSAIILRVVKTSTYIRMNVKVLPVWFSSYRIYSN